MPLRREEHLQSQQLIERTTDLAALLFDHTATLECPSKLINVSSNCGLSVEITHAATLTSRGMLQDGRVSPLLISYFEHLAKSGINALYVPGVFKTAAFSELIMPFFAERWASRPNPAHVGPSVFSVDDYVPRDQIGSWKNFAKLSAAAEKFGIELVIDFIPNTIGVGSEVARQHPEYLRDYGGSIEELSQLENLLIAGNLELLYKKERQQQQDHTRISQQVEVWRTNERHEIFVYRSQSDHPEESYTIYLQRSNNRFWRHAWIVNETAGERPRVFCKKLGSDGGIVWADVFMLATETDAVKEWQAKVLADLAEKAQIIRLDMAHLPNPRLYSDLRERINKQGRSMPILWGEAYGLGVHDTLAYRGVVTYAGFFREWLRQDPPNIPAILHLLYDAPHGVALFGRSFSIAYTANHDDSHGPPGPREGAIAAIVCSLPVPIVMWAQGQRFGDPRRYGADCHVPMEDYLRHIRDGRAADPQYADYMERLSLLARAPVFRHRNSSWHPVHFSEVQGRDNGAIFHISRSWRNYQVDLEGGDQEAAVAAVQSPVERVFVVADCQPFYQESSLVVDLVKTFRIKEELLDQFVLVNLIDGRVTAAERHFTLHSLYPGVGYDVYIYALVPRAQFEQVVSNQEADTDSKYLKQAEQEVLATRI